MGSKLKIVLILLLCAMTLLTLASCTKADNPPCYTLYCGLNDADTGAQILTIENAKETARGIILNNDCGYTEFITHGAYHSADSIISNDTLVYEIYFAEADVVEKIASEIAEELNIMPILIAEGTTSYRFCD